MWRSWGLTVVLLAIAASPGAAQFGLVEGLFERVTDISFYAWRGELQPRTEQIQAEHGLRGFGVELLFQVGAVTRSGPAGAESAATDSVELAWTGRE